MTLRRRLALMLLVPAVLVVVELLVGWVAAAAAPAATRLVLLTAAVAALGALVWVALDWSRRTVVPLQEATQALTQALDDARSLRTERPELRRQRDLALAAARDGVVLLDDHGRMEAANAAARAVLGEAAVRPGTVLAEAPLEAPVGTALAPLLAPAAPPEATHRAPAADAPVQDIGPGDASALAEITHTEDGAVTIYRPERHGHGRLLVLRDVTDEHRFASTEAAVREVVLERRPVCLVELLQSTLAPLSRQAHELGIALQLPTSEDRQIVAVDPVKLPWVITVIVGNALRYTGRLGEVAVEVAREPRAMVVTVRDTGAGMAPDQLDRIFDPPAATDGRPASPGAQGLALAIAREIVAAHGGRLEADSRPGIGTEIRLVLPLDGAPAAGGPPPGA